MPRAVDAVKSNRYQTPGSLLSSFRPFQFLPCPRFSLPYCQLDPALPRLMRNDALSTLSIADAYKPRLVHVLDGCNTWTQGTPTPASTIHPNHRLGFLPMHTYLLYGKLTANRVRNGLLTGENTPLTRDLLHQNVPLQQGS